MHNTTAASKPPARRARAAAGGDGANAASGVAAVPADIIAPVAGTASRNAVDALTYAGSQLIAYIGNKRRLLPFLASAFSDLAARGHVQTFLDPFCGSGSVSRLAKAMGFGVAANDWEMYAWVVTAAHVGIDRARARSLFRGRGGLPGVIRALNAAGSDPSLPPVFIAPHYAPRRTETADYRTERLFYTTENGLFIDRVRSTIESWYPGWDLEGDALSEKLLLVAALLYEASTHSNTSGVFKAFHKGFGGFGGDALGRILAPMQLEVPALIDGTRPSAAERDDAVRFASRRSADLCYLDPPYTVHQYGSNYHLLNTIALWDFPPVSEAMGANGRLREKAAIRKDWVRTRSDYCVRGKALGAMRSLVDAIDARYLALSYNTEGIIPIEELLELLSGQGRVEVRGADYVVYRGGRQSISRGTYNVELLILLDRKRRARATDRADNTELLLRRRLARLMRESFSPDAIRQVFPIDGDAIVLQSGSGRPIVRVPMRGFHVVRRAAGVPDSLAGAQLSEWIRCFEQCLCVDRKAEADVLIDLLIAALSPASDAPDASARDVAFYRKRLGRVIRKLAHRKYRSEFVEAFARAERLVRRHPHELAALGAELRSLHAVAELRFAG